MDGPTLSCGTVLMVLLIFGLGYLAAELNRVRK